MKFTDAQLAFLMTKMTIDDAFITEAAAFKVKRKPRTKVEKVVVKAETCTKVKKNGQPCIYKAKTNGMCGKHAPKSVASALSDEVVSDEVVSDEVVSETSSDVSIDDLAESLSKTAIAEAMVPEVSTETVSPVECVGCGECDSVFRVRMEDGSYIFACENCVDAGAIEGLDYDDL